MGQHPATMTFPAIPAGDGSTTIGVAIAVPEPWFTQLQEQRAAVGDPQAHAIPPHITIVPPTVIDAAALPVVIDHLHRTLAKFAPFTLVLKGTDTFRPTSPVVFVRVAAGAGHCDAIQQAVRDWPLEHRELRFPYHPHVTVAHEVDDEALDAAAAGLANFEAQFEVDAVVLYEHGSDGVWRPVQSIALPKLDSKGPHVGGNAGA